ncbi:MAG: hypothetical protein Q7J10_01010, partial [Methanosarcinaceae archaeon]|nr:hypothetical protein [Methanosarcinaceae archaeon]
SFSEVEEFLLKQGALVPRIRDMRVGGEIDGNTLVSVSFSDPDEAVKEEIKKMDLTSAGLVIDEIVRDMRIGKSKLDAETEMRIGKLIEGMDFTEPMPHIKRDVMPEAMVVGSIPELICEETIEVYVGDSKNEDEGISEDEVEVEVEGEGEGEVEVVVKVDNEYADKGVAEEKAKYGTKKTTSVPKQYNLGDYL